MSIHINIPNGRCKAGTKIAGTVSLRGDKGIDVETMTISLVARCKSKAIRGSGSTSATYRGRAGVIHEAQTLFRGLHKFHPGHEWEFSFTLPNHCTAWTQDLFGNDTSKPKNLFNLNPSQALPPSFESNHANLGWREECFVSYELQAYCAREKAFKWDLTDTRRLEFYTTRDVERPEPRMVSFPRTIACASLALEPGREGISPTFKEKLKGFYTSKLPVARFQLRIVCPSVAVLDQRLPIFLELEHDIEGSSALSPPMIHLRKFSMGLVKRTHIRCLRDEFFREGDLHRYWEDDVFMAACDFSQQMDRAPPVTERMDLRNVLNTRIPKHYKPTFTTFNIRRDYALVIKVTVWCGQKALKAEWTVPQFILLAAEYASPGGTVVGPIRDAGPGPGPGPTTLANAGESAPVYELEPRTAPAYELGSSTVPVYELGSSTVPVYELGTSTAPPLTYQAEKTTGAGNQEAGP